MVSSDALREWLTQLTIYLLLGNKSNVVNTSV